MKSRLLAIAIGNSNVKIGVFQDARLLARWRAHTETNKTADEYSLLLDDFLASPPGFGEGQVSAAIIVSVVPPLTTTFQELCRHHLEIDPVIVGPKVKTGMPIRYENPRALGADRLVAAVAAKAKFGVPVIVIDFGTATTFNVVNRAGEFIGGAIAPGLNLAADSLYHSTAQLPRIDLAMPPQAIATNTTQAIQSGILLGYLGLIEGMVTRIRAEFGEPNARVVATGGLAQMLAPQTSVIDEVDADLVLHGLRVIYEMNKE
ncbi:MAG: type III pantothenate kinase [Chloroflexi bacterium]|nr:type III pantothenate kinase [Chloroflexota bacterium]